MRKYLLLIFLSALVLFAIFTYQQVYFAQTNLTIVFCDVGQGDAIYIRTPMGADILIDGGRDSKVIACLESNMPIFDRTIELVFATHPDADHITGLVDVVRDYNVLSFNTVSKTSESGVYKRLRETIKENKVPYRELIAGDRFKTSDGVTLVTFWPDKDFEGPDTNDYSLVQELSYGSFHALFTGDIPYQILNKITFTNRNFQIFKLPHHGSRTGVDEETFQSINMGTGIISAGRQNSYGHPHKEVLELLEKYRILYKRTDLEGQIKIITDGKTTRVVN